MKFSEVVRLLEQESFRLIKEKGSIRYYAKTGHPHLIHVDSMAPKKCHRHVPCNPESRRPETKIDTMITLPYSLVIEATELFVTHGIGFALAVSRY